MKRFLFISAAAIALHLCYSFSIRTFADDFLKQLGINKTQADSRVSETILIGAFETEDLKKAKGILKPARTAVTKDILAYTKQYLQSAEFRKKYKELKEKKKPELSTAITPEAYMAKNAAMIEESMAETKASLKKADASMKPIFEKVLAEGEKRLKEAKDPNSKQNLNYAQRYPNYAKDVEATNQKLLQDWENRYPTNYMLYVKLRLEEFLAATADVDFDAELVTKGGKQVFVNKQYELKNHRWKMAFRAGKEVIEPARDFVHQWIAEIK